MLPNLDYINIRVSARPLFSSHVVSTTFRQIYIIIMSPIFPLLDDAPSSSCLDYLADFMAMAEQSVRIVFHVGRKRVPGLTLPVAPQCSELGGQIEHLRDHLTSVVRTFLILFLFRCPPLFIVSLSSLSSVEAIPWSRLPFKIHHMVRR